MIVRFTCFAAAMLAMSTAAKLPNNYERSDTEYFCRKCDENREAEQDAEREANWVAE